MFNCVASAGWGDGLFIATFGLGFALMGYGLIVFSQRHLASDDDNGLLFASKSFIAGIALMVLAGLYRLFGVLALGSC